MENKTNMPTAVRRGTGNVHSEPSVLDWVLLMIVSGVPVVGLIILILAAMGRGPYGEKCKNYARAQLIFMAVGAVLAVILISAMAASMGALLGDIAMMG